MGDVKEIVSGTGHCLALMQDGTVMVWGNNKYGQLGIGEGTTYKAKPIQVISLGRNVEKLYAGYYTSMAVMKDGTVMAWGYNNYGQLGTGDTTDRFYPTTITALGTNVKDIYPGMYMTFVKTNEGKIFSFGLNEGNQLGIGKTSSSYITKPTEVTTLGTEVDKIAAGYHHAFALMNDGSVMAWGDNNKDQLGVSNYGKPLPIKIPTLGSNVRDIGTSAYFTVFLMKDGSLMSCGYNSDFQLGYKTDGYFQKVPKSIPGIDGKVEKIKVNGSNALALMDDCSVLTWGDNYYGQLGTGDKYDKQKIVKVEDLGNNVHDIFMSKDCNLVIMKDGSIKVWGDNGAGQLGLTHREEQTRPVTMPPIEYIK